MFWVWIIFLLASWIVPLWRWYQRSRAASWPIANAQIETTQVRKPKFSLTTEQGHYPAELEYLYSVAGSTHLGIYKRDLPSEREADEFLRDLKGKSLPAHYSPSEPARSTLLDSDIETLMQARAPTENTDLADITPVAPSWTMPFLWLLIMIATTGLVLSLWVHIGAIMGKRVAPEAYFFMLHVGIFIVWIPAVFVAQRAVGSLIAATSGMSF
jgi:hypothetical protein